MAPAVVITTANVTTMATTTIIIGPLDDTGTISEKDTHFMYSYLRACIDRYIHNVYIHVCTCI